MARSAALILGALVTLAVGCESQSVAGPEVRIKLGGQFCEMYPEPLTAALKQVAGVEAVEVEAEPGVAIVRGQAGAMDLSALKAAVNGVHGEGWHCEVEGVE